MLKRDYYFDNAKFILIVLVVFGHIIQPFIQDSHLIYTIYTFIYTFHMPAFILIGGYFSKGVRRKEDLLKYVKKLLIPYLIFQGLYGYYYFFLYQGKVGEFQFLYPQWALWFLLSLFFWNVLLLLFRKLDKRISILLALTIGVCIGYINEIGHFLSLSRTFVFFPLFLIGYFLKKGHFRLLYSPAIKVLSFFIFFLCFFAIYLLPEFNYGWLFGSKPYEALNQEVIGGAIRLGLYGAVLISSLCFFALVPAKQYFFTKWGTRTLYVYLLHGFIVRYFRNSEFLHFFEENESIFLLAGLSLIITFVLSSNFIRMFTQPIIECRVTVLKKFLEIQLATFKNNKELNKRKESQTHY